MSRQPASRPVPEDPEWAIATSVQIQQPTDSGSGDSAGRIAARCHPTGWFITASPQFAMSAEELADFRHFVAVRVYLLLHNGPIPGAWKPGAASGEWVADLPVVHRVKVPDVAELFGR